MTPRHGARAPLGAALVVYFASSCAPDFDTTRQVAPGAQGTLGEEIHRALCERVHFGETPTDLAFERGRVPCTQGLSATAPAPAGVGPRTVALGRMRREVAASLDVAMPRETHTPLDRLLINLLPLYGPDGTGRVDAMRRPLIDAPDGGTTVAEDLLPQTTRAVASLLTQFAGNADALAALERMSLRRGYRPARVAFGIGRPVLAYDRVDDLLDTTLRLFRDPTLVAPAGTANAQFNQVLSVMRGEMGEAGPATAAESVGGTTLDATLDLMFRQDMALASGAPVELVRRNAAGFALLNGPVSAPFVDTNGDGAADTVRGVPVDAQRRTIRDLPSPFPAYNTSTTTRDAAGRATATAGGDLRYQFANLDTSMVGAMTRQVPGLMAGDDPPAFRLMHGMQALLGARVDATKMYASGPVAYRQFSMEGSPLPDLLHAVGVLLTHEDAPAVLRTLQGLTSPQREAVTARLLGAALAVDAVADRYPDVTMDGRSVIWDDVMDVARRIAEEPGLLEDVLDAVVESLRPLPATGLWQARCAGTVPLENLSRAFHGYMRYRDRVEPDWSSRDVVNGFPAWNRQVDVTLSRPVDRAQPDTQSWQSPGTAADNRSAMGRIFHLVDDLNGARMCNKNHAAARIHFNIPILNTPTAITIPGAGDIAECGLVEIPDAATFFLRTVVGGGRAAMPMALPGLGGTVTDIARRFGLNLDPTLDGIVQSQSEIQGFNSQPTPFAVARMVFHPSPNEFVSDLLDPVVIRNRDGAGVTPERVVRNYHRGTLFAWESYCFYDSVRPIASAFTRHDRFHRDSNTANDILDPAVGREGLTLAQMAPRNIDSSRGSKLFAELFVAFHRHWATSRAGDFQTATRCATCAAGRNFSYQDGASRYEPILHEVLEGDLLPALGAATAALRDVDPDAGMCQRRQGTAPARCTGVDALATVVRALVQPSPRALDGTPGLAAPPTARGSAVTRTTWSDGTTPTDVTLFTLFADGFNAMDPLLARDAAQRQSWESARSAMVDQFMTVTGTGTSARFQNGAMGPITRMTLAWALDRLAAHRTAGDLERWARDPDAGLAARLVRSMRTPTAAGALDLGLAVRDDAAARATMAAFTRYLFSDTIIGDQERNGTNHAIALTAVADLLQVLRADADIDPFLRAMAPVMTPRTGTVPLGLRFLDRSRGYDPDRVLTRVLGNLARRPATGDALAPEPLVVLLDAMADTNRQTPSDRGPMAAADFQLALRAVADFFTDDRRSMEQFYQIVQRRRLPQ
ncbi:MAG: hypothetical protein U0324_37465 [Polyangiales bacterium]